MTELEKAALTQALATTEPEVPTIDLDLLDWERIKEAAAASKWIPPEYYQNDWVADVCEFLKDRPQPAPTAPDVPETNFGNTTERKADPVAKFDEIKGRPVLLPDSPMLKHGDLLYTSPQETERKGEPVGEVDQIDIDEDGQAYACVSLQSEVELGTKLYTSTQVPEDVQRDAERYRFLAEKCRSTSEHWGGRWSIVIEGPAPKSHDSEDDLDEAIDAARKGE